MSMNHQVDILMATYNGEKFLREQIHSILQQTHQNFRLLICDDGSTDGTEAIIQEFVAQFPDKIEQVSRGDPLGVKKLGAKGNFSFLMEHSKAEYIMFSDQDDLWIKEKIEKTINQMYQMEALYGKDKPLLVHTDLKVVDRNCQLLGASFWEYANLKAHRFKTTNRFLIQNVVTGCTMMLNRPLSLLSSPVPPESLMHDWWIALVASTFGKIDIVKEPTILYRQHGNNTLGAKKFGTLKFFIEAFKRLIKNDKSLNVHQSERVMQAKVFLKRYEAILSESTKSMIKDYLNFPTFGWFKKRKMVLKHGFYRSGFLRNALTFLIRLNP